MERETFEQMQMKGSQHGFTKWRSCLTNLLEFYEVVSDWMDEESAVDVVHLDFQKCTYLQVKAILQAYSHAAMAKVNNLCRNTAAGLNT